MPLLAGLWANLVRLFFGVANIWSNASLTNRDLSGHSAARLTYQRPKRIIVVADLVEKRKHGRVGVDEHGGQPAGGGRIAEVAEQLGPAAAAHIEKRSASLGLVPQDPQRSAVVGQVSALVLNVQLARPDVLAGDHFSALFQR